MNQPIEITHENIEIYRGECTFRKGDLDSSIWDIFDKEMCTSNTEIIPTQLIVSTKNQLEDPTFKQGKKLDSRITAFKKMKQAAAGRLSKREPLSAIREGNQYLLEDGNATFQVLLLCGWDVVPVNTTNNN